MDEEDAHIAASQPKESPIRHGKGLVGHEKPGTEARQAHLDPHKWRLAKAEHKGHEGIGFASAVLYEKKRKQRIESRGSDHKEEQQGGVLGRTVYVGSIGLARAAKPFASPPPTQGAPQRGRMPAAVRLPPALAENDSDWTVHAVLRIFAAHPQTYIGADTPSIDEIKTYSLTDQRMFVKRWHRWHPVGRVVDRSPCHLSLPVTIEKPAAQSQPTSMPHDRSNSLSSTVAWRVEGTDGGIFRPGGMSR